MMAKHKLNASALLWSDDSCSRIKSRYLTLGQLDVSFGRRACFMRHVTKPNGRERILGFSQALKVIGLIGFGCLRSFLREPNGHRGIFSEHWNNTSKQALLAAVNDRFLPPNRTRLRRGGVRTVPQCSLSSSGVSKKKSNTQSLQSYVLRTYQIESIK